MDSPKRGGGQVRPGGCPAQSKAPGADISWCLFHVRRQKPAGRDRTTERRTADWSPALLLPVNRSSLCDPVAPSHGLETSLRQKATRSSREPVSALIGDDFWSSEIRRYFTSKTRLIRSNENRRTCSLSCRHAERWRTQYHQARVRRASICGPSPSRTPRRRCSACSQAGRHHVGHIHRYYDAGGKREHAGR